MKKVSYNLPQNIDPKLPIFDVFKSGELSEEYPDMGLKSYENVRVASSSVIFNYFNIRRESVITADAYQKYSTGYKFYLKFIFPKISLRAIFSKQTFFLITDEWTSNYYHWHIFALRRLLYLKENNLISGNLLLLPIKYKKYGFALDSLKKFGVTEDQIVFIRRKSNIKVRKLLFPIIGNHNNPEEILRVRAVLLDEFKAKTNLGDKIYISRDEYPIRRVLNEDEVMKVLAKYGFKKVLMHKYSYHDQVSISRNAKYIIGPHGAGLTNLFFAQNGSSILELVTSFIRPTDYYKLSSMLKFNYFLQGCEGDGRDFHHSNMTVNLNELEENLKKIGLKPNSL